MVKHRHEFRDPIHTFISVNSHERRVVDSLPFQRLRHIQQLALTNYVYPGATHKRFEHSLGVMELAGRVFDRITQPDAIHPDVAEVLPELTEKDALPYWRTTLRMAALCHDIGHLPFSHAAEKDLLPQGKSHEDLTILLINSAPMRVIFDGMSPPLKCDLVSKLSVGQNKLKESSFSTWESILSEIIVGDAFGVDRIDYLLRDSYHTGVAYGRFDHFRLIEELRILPASPTGGGESKEPTLGVSYSGIYAAEALSLARYFIYSQVYLHHVRRIYDIHLIDFMKSWLGTGGYEFNEEFHLSMTDNEAWSAILSAARKPEPGSEDARRIVHHQHFRRVYDASQADLASNPDCTKVIFRAVADKFGSENVRMDQYIGKSGWTDFPVIRDDKSVESSMSNSTVLRNIPSTKLGSVYVDITLREKVKIWLNDNKNDVLSANTTEGERR